MLKKLPLIALILTLIFISCTGVNNSVVNPEPGKTASPGAEDDFKKGLLGYWSFNDGTARDNSGNNNDGTIVGSPQVVDGARGKALQFNSTPGDNGCGPQPGGQFIKLKDIDAVFNNGLTISAWARFERTEDNWERIMDLGNGSADTENGVPIVLARKESSNDISFLHWINSSQNDVSSIFKTDSITNGKFKFYSATIDNTGFMKLYVDGVKVSEGQGKPVVNIKRTKNFIGRSNWCDLDADFKGIMDEVRLYNRPLAEPEIKTLFDLK